MADDHPETDFEEITRRFSHLWQALNHGANGQYPTETMRVLTDRVRDALDRGIDRLSPADNEIIANSFTLEALIHDGTAMQVHRARHRELGTLHAIKLLRPDSADDPVTRRLLLREAEIGMSLRHPRLAATQTVLRLPDGRPALVMEWLGDRLADLLPPEALSVHEIMTIMTALLVGLGAIHAAGFVHCDLSPSNLLCSGKDLSALKIADFGIALETGRRHGELDLTFAGQPEFASPEQTAGEPLDGRSDLYAAGRLLSLLLRHCHDIGETTADMKALAMRLSQKDKKDRPGNARAALHLLGGLDMHEVDA